MTSDEQLDAAFAALSHPTRRAILARLAEGPANVNELAEPFDATLPAISNHIRVLEKAKLITRGKFAQFRPCTLDAETLKAVANWTDQYRHIWAERFDAMDRILTNLKEMKMTEQQSWVRIKRDFDAPIGTIWRMWTDPELFKQWYGPKGMSVPVAEMDLSVGGTRKICMEMTTPDRTMTMWSTGVFKEIQSPTRLVYTESMCQEDGTIISAKSMGMPDGTPDITEVIVDLSETNGGTKMTMVHVGIPEGSPGAGGWGQAFDKLTKLTEANC